MEREKVYQLSKDLLIKTLIDEQDAIVYYMQLQKMTTDKECINLLSEIYADEIKHFHALKNLYVQIAMENPLLPKAKMPEISSFISGVSKAIIDELNAYELYRDIYLANKNEGVRNLFFEAQTDENEHAAKLNYMYTKIISEKFI